MTARLPLIASALALAAAGASAGAQTASKQRQPRAAATSAAAPVAAPTDTATPAAPAASAPMTAQTTADGATPTAAAPQDASATPNPTVGGAPMLATRTIVENAAAAPNLTPLVTAVKAAGLDTTLSGPGPFTVFAPTNEAFGRLAPGTLDQLMKPEQKASLAKVLSYHVVSGRMTLADLKAKTAAGGGTATLTTVAGQPLTVTYADNVMTLTDPNGNKSYVETPDVMQSNGVVHVVNGVLVPTLK